MFEVIATQPLHEAEEHHVLPIANMLT